jgi:hypothetical protein
VEFKVALMGTFATLLVHAKIVLLQTTPVTVMIGNWLHTMVATLKFQLDIVQ